MANTKKDAPKQETVLVKTPANIRRKCVGSKLFKLDRDDKPIECINRNCYRCTRGDALRRIIGCPYIVGEK